MGVKMHDIIPVCFEKSRWTVVAVLGVMKAGGTLAMMDPSLPVQRLRGMAIQVGAQHIVSSVLQNSLASEICPSLSQDKILVVDETAFANLSESEGELEGELDEVPADVLMYIIFTSGSTGTPKGVKISHSTYTSSAFPRASAVGYTPSSRVLDFASYAFDVSIDSMLLTLSHGGTLCIPSDADRLNDINSVIRSMRINYAGLTPSVARILDPDVVRGLEALGLGGEASSARDVNAWGRKTRIVIGYGPCECTIGCTINSSAATGRDYIHIGQGNGACIWIVDPNDHGKLVPFGAVGEILIEGPIVGQGYLNDEVKTKEVFIDDPTFLVEGWAEGGFAGRRGRCYKSGDLGRWDPDGLGGVIFAGRKDTQVKLRGQRVELGEIESQLKARLPAEATVIVDIITPAGKGAQPTLVAFIACQASGGHGKAFDIESAAPTNGVREALQTIDKELGKVLPRYMVPNAYIPVNGIPVLISGKSDRKLLRAFGAKVDLRKLDQESETAVEARELSDVELRLRKAWSVVLKCEEESIRLEDNFFALGGESLTAMKLVSVCRADGLELSVIGTFGNPTLVAMATVVTLCDSQEVKAEIAPFSMIAQAAESACLEASQICEIEVEKVRDVYPCTPTQESLFTFSLKSVKPYVAQRVACIPSHISIDAWKKAWESVVDASPILSTRLAQLQEPGLMQVVLKERITWTYPSNLEEYLIDDKKSKMELGERLARYAIIDNAADGKTYMVWTVHHVLYDGWSEPLILQQVNSALQQQQIETQVQMRDFVKYVRDTDEVAMQAYWRQELKGADGPQFPRLPTRDYMPIPDAFLEHHIPFESSAGSQFTLATLIRGAWALVASQYTGSDDVVFGETLTGRDISLAGVENIVGPLIATVPVRVRIDRKASVESYLQTVQRGMLARTPYQHMGMQNIRKVSTDAQYACEAGTGLVIQPESDHIASELGFNVGDAAREALYFNPYPLMLACGIGKGGFRICASFDSSLIEVTQMERILAQLETACMQLTKGLERKVEDISCLPQAQLNDIWTWNQTPPLSLDKSTNLLRASASTKQGSAYPRAVVPWVCDTRNPALLSPIGCVGELWLEGDLLSSETKTSPAWLLAGSSTCAGRMGTVQATGDMVQLQPDGNLIFVGRRENVMPVQGHAVDITLLESHFAKHLPWSSRAAVAMLQSTSDESQQELIVFVEQGTVDEESVEIMPAKITIGSSETEICASITTSLVIALRKLDKSLRDNLPSYMIPSTYVVVEKLSQTEHSALNQLASDIPQDVLLQLRAGLKEAWAKTSEETSLTPSETILRSAWAKILGMDAKEIDLEDNFFRLGGDSVLAMKLVSSLRVQGHGLTVADIFQNMRLVAAAKVLRVSQVSMEQIKTYKPFSTLGSVEVETFVSEIVRMKLADPSWTVQDVAPVTDSQALDIRATIQKPRTSIQYTLMYFNQDVEGDKMARICDELVKTHDILRTVFIEHDSKFFQVVVDKLVTPLVKHQTDKDLKQYVKNLCTAEIETDFLLGTSFARFYHVQDADGQSCLILSLSHAQYDGVSLPMLLRDLETLYTGGKIPNPEPFSTYIAHTHDEKTQAKAVSYWRDTLSGSSLSVIKESGQPTDKSIFHTKEVDITQRPEEITTANLLTAAWALVLARRLQKPDVTFGSVTSGRTLDLANAENIQGPCYQITPVRVAFQQQWTAMDLLRFVQKQSAESAAYDFLGFEKISKQCTQWSLDSEMSFFDSIVHHQDFEDFDTMPFAGGDCTVDILNPHGDAAHPVKAVSFVKGGKAFVGTVGSENAAASVDLNLDELAAAIQELAISGSEQKLLGESLF